MLELRKAEGKLIIKGDEALISQLEGADLSGVDLSGFRATADDLYKAYELAVAQPVKEVKDRNTGEVIGTVDNVKKYGALKQKCIAAFEQA
jgi:hypothetical protein